MYYFCHPILTHGVIGNTSVFGTDIQGSSPCGSTQQNMKPLYFQGFHCLIPILVVDIVVEISILFKKWLNLGQGGVGKKTNLRPP